MTLGTLNGPLTIIGSVIFCKPVSKYEIIGTLIIIGAAFLIILDPTATRVGDNEPNILADLVCLNASLALAFFFKLSEVLNQYLELYLIVYCQNILMMIMFITLALTEEDVDFSFTDKGLFGFLQPDNFVEVFVLYGILSGFMACAGYLIATKFFNPLVVMNSLLIEPFIS